MRQAIVLLSALLCGAPALASPHGGGDYGGLAEALANPRRTEDAARDADRHPEQTLRFFDVQATHTVAEYAPGRGWYTRILVPYLAPRGTYIAVSFGPEAVPIPRLQQALAGFAEGFPGQVQEMTGVPAAEVTAYLSSAIPEGAEGSVDRILIPRMLHNLLRWGIADTELMALRRLLKDDGLVGVVQHRAPADAPYADTDGNQGYLHEADVVALMALYGFELVGSSEINANPRDPANHAAGVWALPPSFRGGEEDRERYAAIGESDRMTLIFRKAP